MAITKSDRDVGIMAHFTADTKERFRAEAERRKVSMSQLLSDVVEEWLRTATGEQLEEKRSNKRGPIDPLRDIPLPLENQ